MTPLVHRIRAGSCRAYLQTLEGLRLAALSVPRICESQVLEEPYNMGPQVQAPGVPNPIPILGVLRMERIYGGPAQYLQVLAHPRPTEKILARDVFRY